MLIPRFWAEARLQQRTREKQVTIRRFGWSDVSPEDAQRHANERAREALQRALSGIPTPRREAKVVYGGSEGLPIREEVLERYGDAVLTRNGYGAKCLNTPNVLFVDIDFDEQGYLPSCLFLVFSFMLSIGAGIVYRSFAVAVVGVVISIVLSNLIGYAIHLIRRRFEEQPDVKARKRIDRFLATRPDWHFRLYRTPAGFRLLAMHRTFDPQEPEVAECFRELGADPIYVHMCLMQNCFRARVSPKPWRIGIAEHIRPRPGVWPVNPEYQPVREEWIARYEEAAREFSSCQFVESLGSGVSNSTTLNLQRLHDELSQANTSLPMA